MSYTLLGEAVLRGRKDHRCIWCGETIPAGELHRHERSMYEGQFQDHRWHLECDQAFKANCAHGETDFEPYGNERPAVTQNGDSQ